MQTNELSPELLHKMDAYWRAANYLSVGQIYLYDNPLLKRRRAFCDQVRWIAELAERTLESAHDRARIDTRLARVREVLEAEPALCPGRRRTSHVKSRTGSKSKNTARIRSL